jgi:hypothetical protein
MSSRIENRDANHYAVTLDQNKESTFKIVIIAVSTVLAA